MENLRRTGFDQTNAVEREAFNAQRMVVKIGTSTITNAEGNLDYEFIDHVADQVNTLRESGVKVAIISSGAVPCGEALLRDYSGESILSKQVLATRGQTRLMSAWGNSFDRYGIHTFQYLLTQSNLEHPEFPLHESMEIGVPIINFNDGVSDAEMRQVRRERDNDDIAVRVAKLVDADTTVFLTQGIGVLDKTGGIVAVFAEDAEHVVFSGVSKGGTGGMEKKVGFAKEVAELGTNVFIAEGRTKDILLRIARGEHIGTRVIAGESSK